MKYEETRVSIVTGAGIGIGLAIAQTLAKSDHAIVVVDINLTRVEDLAVNLHHSGSSALTIHADLSQRDDAEGIVATTLENYGHVDVLVNNAGIMNSFTPLLNMDEALLARGVEPLLAALPKQGKPEDTAALVGFLASDAARAINGAIVTADHGWTVG